MHLPSGSGFVATALATVLITTPAFAGPGWISVEIPANPHRPATRNALFLVRTYHHWVSADSRLAGTAEGLVNGVRKSVALEFTKAPAEGVYAVSARVPREGAWLAVIRATELEDATVLVSLGTDGQVIGAEVPANTTNDGWKVPRRVTEAEVDAALRKHAARLASADRTAPLAWSLAVLGVVVLVPLGMAARR